ncbi:dirigent protein 22-like [Andrographis paniculata]|uniref:dirigent protein 22-like n=1 Tax=Andrographis paniculata TaxID=175694 RepID=UPI0021E913ED|nr:dirigent protein 22-like [Andrographis paniculata]
MEKHTMPKTLTIHYYSILMLLLHATALLAAGAPHIHKTTLISPRPEAVEKWLGSVPTAGPKKISKLRFYFHNRWSSKKPTVVGVAEANSSAASPTGFGQVVVMDNPMTEGPEPDSKMVGWARGIYASTAMEEIGLLLVTSFVFNDRDGSTISVVGHNRILQKYREMPVVGGTGRFRLAQGVLTVRTLWFNTITNNAVVECNLMLLH